MYAALDKDGILINAQNAKGNQEYFCSQCSQSVKLISNKSKCFFRHKSIRNNSINERDTHLKGKQLIIETLSEFKNIHLKTEYYLPQLKQRPDILVNGKIAIEYQCAKISSKILENRVLGYKSIKIRSIWILGENYLKDKIGREHLKFISYNLNWGYYILMLDSEKQELKLIHHLKFTGPFNKLAYQMRIFDCNNFSNVFRFKPKVKKLSPIKINQFLIKKLRQKNDQQSQSIKLLFYNKYQITVEEFLENKSFYPIKPIYTTASWQIRCGQAKHYLRQPLLND